jgi:hypothetical protein
VNRGNDDTYLDNYPLTANDFLQGQVESFVNYKNGVRTANRGSGDIMAILIRRGREMGLPSFTDIRDTVLVPTPPTCVWNTWTDTATCNATALFKQSALSKLKTLYKTPADVELIVGSLLSNDPVPAELSPELNQVGIDRTQAYLIFGEIERIIQRDIFGILNAGVGSLLPDSYYARFVNDDPNDGQGFAVTLLDGARTLTLSNLIWTSSEVSCLQQNAFCARGGVNTVEDSTPNYRQLQNLGQPENQRLNCDISEDTRATITFFEGALTYDDLFCGGDPDNCFRPSLPYCVE